MLSFILALLHLSLVEAPAGYGRIHGQDVDLASSTLTVFALAVIILVLGYTLARFAATKSSGIALAAFIFTVYTCTCAAVVYKLGSLGSTLIVFADGPYEAAEYAQDDASTVERSS